jgi:hypothetical protein
MVSAATTTIDSSISLKERWTLEYLRRWAISPDVNIVSHSRLTC